MAKRLGKVVLTLFVIHASVSLGVIIECVPNRGPVGGEVEVAIRFSVEEGEEIGGAQVDIEYDTAFFDAVEPGGNDPRCVIDPSIGPGTDPDKRIVQGFIDDTATIRGAVAAQNNLEPIPAGPLFSCTFRIPENTPRRPSTINLVNAISSDVAGDQLPTDTVSCEIEVVDAPTPTTTATAIPTATPTQEGFCNGDGDCPGEAVCIGNQCATPTPAGFCNNGSECAEDEVCVGNRCVAPTATATPQGFCRSDEDCSGNERCVGERCTAPTPTPEGFCTSDEQCADDETCVGERCTAFTPTPVGFCEDANDCQQGEVCTQNMCTASGGGGGGCSCSIQPDPPTRAALNVLLALLPILWLQNGRRRTKGD